MAVESYRPAGSASASCSARSISATRPRWLTTVRATPTMRSGSSAALRAKSV